MDCGFNRVRSEFGQGIQEGESICSWEFYGEFNMWIFGIVVLLKFVDLISPGDTVESSMYLNQHLIHVRDVGMAKDSKCFM